MYTEKQREASRRNGSKSRGPTSPAGKRISSQNSFKTGLYSQALVTHGEKLEDFEALRDEYYAHHSPQTPEERETLDTVIQLAWQLRRYAMVETHSWNLEIRRAQLHAPAHMLEGNLYGSAFFGADQRFARLSRMQSAIQRNFKDALHQLELLKASRPAQSVEEETTSPEEEIAVGFVPSTGTEQALPPADAAESGILAPVAALPAASPVAENTPVASDPGFVPPLWAPTPLPVGTADLCRASVPIPRAPCYHPNDADQSHPIEQRPLPD
jgi:hypothetical protein